MKNLSALNASNPIRIAIDINVVPGVIGGAVQSTMGLVRSLGQLDGPEQYTLVTSVPQQADFIRPYCGSNQQIVSRGKWRPPVESNGSAVKRILRPIVRGAREIASRFAPTSAWPIVPVSDGFHESLGCDVIHFPTQAFTLCALPTIYNPHDLQHLHYPQFFTAKELAARETIYPTACHFANTIVVGSEWIKQDVIRQYHLSPEKIQIIPWAPPTLNYPEISRLQIDDVAKKYSLNLPFAFYPAVAWPHKNHLRLFEAMAMLRDRHGITINLVCTGARYEPFWPQIQSAIQRHSLQSQIKFLGYLPETDLRALYQLAQFLILPTLFEADSCPIHEAWTEGLPVASADITALPDQVGDAGLLFDPKHIPSIADALREISQDAQLREKLIQRGYRRVKDFSWDRTARAFRAVYRRAAGQTLNDEDRWLLQWDWMREPKRAPLIPKQILSATSNQYVTA